MNVSLISIVKEGTRGDLIRTLESLSSQPTVHWNWILVVEDKTSVLDVIREFQKTSTHPLKHKIAVIVDTDLTAIRRINEQLSLMGSWIGFIEFGDFLSDEALPEMVNESEGYHILYSDERHVSRWGWISFINYKPGLNPHRLRFHNYLQDLLLVRKSTLTAFGGFDETVTDDPMHDVILKVLDAYGVSAFKHVSNILYSHQRKPLEPRSSDPREPEYIPQYDLQAIKLDLVRRGVPAVVEQIHGIPKHRLLIDEQPEVTAVVFLPDDLKTGRRILLELDSQDYPRLHVKAISRIKSVEYEQICKDLKFSYQKNQASEPTILNEELSNTNSRLVLVLKGLPLGWDWLRDWIKETMQDYKICAIGSKIFSGRTLTQPGIMEWKYEGFDWNHRGRFSEIAVPHQVSMLSPVGVLINVSLWKKGEPFNENLPTYYMMEWGPQMDTKGYQLIYTPTVSVVTQTRVDSLEEFGLVEMSQDPYDLHG